MSKILDNLVREAYKLDKLISESSAKLAEYKSKIQDEFDKEKISEYESKEFEDTLSGNTTQVVVKKTERATISYDVDALREKLEKDMFNELTIKSYSVADIDLLVKTFKKANIQPKVFKQCIETNYIVNKAAIQQLYDLGEISLADLKGCYTASISKGLKITEREVQKH